MKNTHGRATGSLLLRLNANKSLKQQQQAYESDANMGSAFDHLLLKGDGPAQYQHSHGHRKK